MDRNVFAGFTYPRKIARWTGKPRADRKHRWCFAYRQNRPAMAGRGLAGYLGESGWPHLRWTWCDEVDGGRIDHTGWWCDPQGDGETVRGIVLRLPHGRGFLAGASMGEGMSTWFEPDLHTDESSAARSADQIAECAAEKEREYQEAWRAGNEAGDAWREAMSAALDCASSARVMLRAARVALRRALAQRDGDAVGMVPPEMADEARRLYRQALESCRDKLDSACETRREAWREFRSAQADHSWQSDAFAEGAAL